MEDEFFTGDIGTLKNHWEDEDRAKKFVKGGTRVGAVQYLVNRIEVDVHNGVWIDTAIGSGYVQSQLYRTVEPTLILGLDFSRAMLEQIDDPRVHRIMGSVFHVPVRDKVSSVTTNIFCLSDYPNPGPAFEEMDRVTDNPGMVCYLDYSIDDDYWTMRQSKHGEEGKDGDLIIGNIHLRSLENLEAYFPEELRKVESTVIRYEIDSSNIQANFQLPDMLNRAFVYIEFYKPRSLQ